MTLPVDKPRPVVYKYRGVDSIIRFAWAAGNNQIPEALRIDVKTADGAVHEIREHAEHLSFEDAVNEGRLHVRNFVDKLLGQESSV